METPSLEQRERIERQFNSFCTTVLRNERIDYYRQQSNEAKHQVVFSDMEDFELDQLSEFDEYEMDVHTYRVMGCDIDVKNSLLAEALDALTQQKRDIILMAYYQDMNDSEIARRKHINPKTVNEHHKRSLEILRKILERTEEYGTRKKKSDKK